MSAAPKPFWARRGLTAPKRPNDPDRYAERLAPYKAGSATARQLAYFIEDRLTPVDWADDLYHYAYGGLHGVVAFRSAPGPKDCKDKLVGLAFYARRKLDAPFTRDKEKYPRAVLSAWITLPEAYAHVVGGIDRRLRDDELGVWSHRFKIAAGVARSYVFAPLPDPDSDEADKPDSPWRNALAVGSANGKRRRDRRKERLMYALYLKVLVPAWIKSAASSLSGVPGKLARSDGFLAAAVREHGFDATHDRVRSAMAALDAGGFVVAAATTGDAFESGKRVRAGHYRYLPGSGKPPSEATRAQGKTTRDTERALRAYWKSQIGPNPVTRDEVLDHDLRLKRKETRRAKMDWQRQTGAR